MKRRQTEAGFLSPRSSKITVGEGKGKGKKKERGERKEEKRKKAMVALSVFIMSYFGDVENCWTQKVHLAITFSKIPVDKQKNSTTLENATYSEIIKQLLAWRLANSLFSI